MHEVCLPRGRKNLWEREKEIDERSKYDKCYHMAYRNIRTSMALDQWTLNTLKLLGEKLGISKSEVMRRAVRTLNEQTEQQDVRPSPLAALEYLQSSGLSVREADAFREELQAERQAKRYWWE
jgi:hypothetical protein